VKGRRLSRPQIQVLVLGLQDHAEWGEYRGAVGAPECLRVLMPELAWGSAQGASVFHKKSPEVTSQYKG